MKGPRSNERERQFSLRRARYIYTPGVRLIEFVLDKSKLSEKVKIMIKFVSFVCRL